MEVLKYHWRKSLHVTGNYWTFSNFRVRQLFAFQHSLFESYKDHKKRRLARATRHIIWGIWEGGAKPPSCFIPPFAECQTRIYVTDRSHTNVSYHQTLGYLSYNQTSATARTISPGIFGSGVFLHVSHIFCMNNVSLHKLHFSCLYWTCRLDSKQTWRVGLC